MKITFKKNETKKICEDESYARRKLPMNVVPSLKNLLMRLQSYDHFEVFLNTPLKEKYRTHELHGQKRGIYSLSINYHYRMELTVEIQVESDVICILEVSNHYGD